MSILDDPRYFYDILDADNELVGWRQVEATSDEAAVAVLGAARLSTGQWARLFREGASGPFAVREYDEVVTRGLDTTFGGAVQVVS